MGKHPLYTIGHGNRKIEDFLALIKGFNIKYLVDVRSQPYSKFNPQFNQNELKYFLEVNEVKYVFMGDCIGGRPKDISCYDNDGKVDYDIVRTKEFFLIGINRLKTAFYKDVNIVIMCSESNPCECHRSKLIGRFLKTENIHLKHIDENSTIDSRRHSVSIRVTPFTHNHLRKS